LTIPDSATSVDRNLEVLRGLSEPELLRLLGKLQEPVPPPSFGALEEVGPSSMKEIEKDRRRDSQIPKSDQKSRESTA
jgi:hypothetical protein